MMNVCSGPLSSKLMNLRATSSNGFWVLAYRAALSLYLKKTRKKSTKSKA
jgi:hypothetical protein